MTRNTLALDGFLPYRLSVLSNVVSAAIAAHYATRFALSIPEWRVMAVLALEPGLSAAQVASRTAMDKVAVSRAVSSLLRARRLERRVSAGDRRRSVLQLSPAGFAVYKEVVPAALGYEQSLLQPLTAADRRHLDRLLGMLQRRAVALDASPADTATPRRKS